MLIGNKADLISQRQVSKEEGIKIAQVRTTETTDKVSMHLFTMEIHEAPILVPWSVSIKKLGN